MIGLYCGLAIRGLSGAPILTVDLPRPPLSPQPPLSRGERRGDPGVTLSACLSTGEGAPVVGDRLASFELRTLDDKPYAWKPGRTTVLSFCAFWCDTWKDQLPRVREVSNITKGLPVDYATVSVDGRWTERAKSAAAGLMLGDPGGAWTHSIGIDRVPYTLVVSASGRVAWAGYGTVRKAALADAVRASVAERAVVGGRVFLTFDDFPAERLSDELLDALRAEGVKATLFCIGSKVAGAKDLIRRAVREGHAIGIHSWAHDGDRPELARCVEAIRAAGGGSAELYRPPGSEKVLTLKGEALALPVNDPYDYTRPGAEELARRVLLGARPNAVIQLHAGVDDTIKALPKILRSLRERGFRFELLGPQTVGSALR